MQEETKGDTSNYKPNGEFELLTFKSVRNVIIYSLVDDLNVIITHFLDLHVIIYSILQVDLVQEETKGDTSNYKPNGEFDLLTFKSVRNVIIYSCCMEPYPDITYTIRLKRRPMFYIFNLILPSLLINAIGEFDI